MSMVPPAFRDRMPDAAFALENFTEQYIREKGEINSYDDDLKTSFWLEFDYAKSHGKPMVLSRVYHGACSHQYFYNTFLKNKFKLAWVITPPKSYVVKVETILRKALEKLEMVVDLDPVTIDDDGVKQVNLRLAAEIRAIGDMMDKRKHGMYVQNINMKTEERKEELPQSETELKKKLADLRARNPELITHEQ